ncbi:MAG: tRNA pseudouridine(54/55) synthase Pus10 [Halobacteriota archaeon]|nr:tRNA pseudouridine(54/55) synthase Pus10 [Halobacteriota archaeon]
MNLIDHAVKVMEEGPICDSCLGRQFAKLSTGLTNRERGSSIRKVISMTVSSGQIDGDKDDCIEGVPDPKFDIKERCWVCNGLMDQVKEWARKATAKLDTYEYDSFLVGTKVTGLISENEEIIWAEAGASWAEPLKSEMNREVGKEVSLATGKDVDFKRPDIAVLLDLQQEEVHLQVNSLFIYGRYRKLLRGIPQTRWFCRECNGAGCDSCDGTGKRYAESVEELIIWPSLAEFEGSDASLHGAGREDIDALMLGDGRPFVLEVKEPKTRNVDVLYLQNKINEASSGKVEVLGLRYTDKETVKSLKTIKADKVYRIKIETEERIEKERLNMALSNLEGVVRQKTPTRVLHRRSDLKRERKVHEARLISIEDDNIVLEVSCEGGLYVKELISGDDGRTEPSLSDLLGVDLMVSELDVTSVKIDEEIVKN